MYKKGLKVRITDFRSAVSAMKNRLILGGMVIYILGLGVYLYALSGAALSIVYPTFASTFIFVTLFSAVTLKEKITGKRALGILMVFFGVVIIAISI